MEGFFEFLGFIALIAIPILWSRVSKLREQAREAEERHRMVIERVAQLELKSTELGKLPAQLKALDHELHTRPAVPIPTPAEAPAGAPPLAAPSSPPAAVPRPPAPSAPAEHPVAAKPAVPPPTAVPPPPVVPPPGAVPPATRPATAAPTPPAAAPARPAAPPSAATTPPVSAPGPVAPAAAPKPTRRSFDIEQALGTNWLSKLGIIILVFGVVFWLGTQWQKIGPGWRVAIGYAVGGALLAGGILLEQKWDYKLLGRTTAGGGWALLYFTTYAMHHVAATKVIDSQSVDLTLLLVVAAAMVVHTLRYDSQTATSIAFLLGFATVTFSRDTVYSLSASAVLAAALVVIVLWRRWYELEVFGLLASYLNHFLWLRGIIDPMGEHHHDFPGSTASILLLFFYWAVFRVSYVLRRDPGKNEEQISTIAALLNIGLLLALLRYQSLHPELAFWALLGLGATELAIGQLPRLRVQRRPAFLTLTTVGVSLLIAAFPFRYSGSNLSVLWLVEGEALFIVGVMSREAVFRHFGVLTAG
ncbi:MAG TPA: DUF2339 domain-containing protein, partial [Candidatus Acidoferrales bacterium]|nr:DUF2339 domain-containing protein [Candidatus Acidoferrales bacterium]